MYKVHISFDIDKEITLQSVPGQYVKEDGQIKDPPVLDEENSQKLVDKRVQSFLAQLQQLIFTAEFYGANIEGSISSGIGKEEN